MTFSSLLQASEKKGLFDDIIGRGDGAHELPVTALPQGTIRKHYKGYEEVIIPPKPTAPMKPGEKLVFSVFFCFFKISLVSWWSTCDNDPDLTSHLC